MRKSKLLLKLLIFSSIALGVAVLTFAVIAILNVEIVYEIEAVDIEAVP